MTDVPQHVREAAKAAFRRYEQGRVVLQPVDLNGAGGSSTSQTRALLFAGEDVCVHVTVARDGARNRVGVRLEPDVAAVVELQHPDPDLSCVARGRSPLQLDAVPDRLARLVITPDGDAPVGQRWQTAWTRF